MHGKRITGIISVIIFTMFFSINLSGDLINESFEGATYPPSGWITNSTPRKTTWHHTGSYSVQFNANTDYLITPLLTYPTKLIFWVLNTSPPLGFIVEYSNASGGSWVQITNVTNSTIEDTWVGVTNDISTLSNIYIRFRRSVSKYHYLDDVRVTSEIESVNFQKENALESVVSPGDTNIPIIGFKITDSSNGGKLQKVILRNAGTIVDEEISRLKLYYDNDADVLYDTSDTYICDLKWNGADGWTNNNINASVGSSNTGTNFVIIMDLKTTATDDHYFRAYFETNSVYVTNVNTSKGFLLPSQNLTNANNITVQTESPPKIIISEVCDTSPAGASFVEIYNMDTVPVSLSNWQLRFFNNGSVTPTAVEDLSGTINPGEFRVLAKIAGDFQDKYGFAPDFSHGSFYIIDVGDSIDLYDGSRRVDQFGPIPGDTNSGWPLKDRCYERKNLPNNGTDFTNHWVVSSNQIDGTPGDYNNNGDIIPPWEIVRFTKYDTKSAFVVQEQTNIPIISFKATGISNGVMLKKLKIVNASNMTYSDISRMKLYYDGDANRILTAGSNDFYICDLKWNGTDGWTNNNINASIGAPDVGTNFIVAIDIAPLAVNGRVFICVLETGAVYFTNQTTQTGFLKPESPMTNHKYIRIGEISREVVINEIAWMGTKANYNHEWIELYNTTGDTISLAGWKLYVDTSEYPLSGSIPGNGFYLIERNEDAITNITADAIISFTLSDSGRKLMLFDNNGNPIDIVDCSEGWFAGDKSGKKTMERITPIYDGSSADNWATYSGTGDSFAVDASNHPIMGTPKKTNLNYSPPPHTFSIKRYNVPPIDFYRTNTKILVYAFKGSDTYNHSFTITCFSNVSDNPFNPLNITNVSVYKDTNSNYTYDEGEPFVEKLTYNNGSWYGLASLGVNTNYLILITLNTNGTFGRTFKGQIVKAQCSGGLVAQGDPNVYEQRLISRPPQVQQIILSNTPVSNTGTDYLDIYSVAITNMGDGIGTVTGIISNKYSYYSNIILNFYKSSNGDEIYTNHRVIVPKNIAPTNSFLIVRAYDYQDYDFLSNMTEFTVKGNWPPVIESFTISPSDVFATGLSNISSITITLIAKDRDGTNKHAYLDFTELGGGIVELTNTTGSTLWQYVYVVGSNVSAGTRQIKAIVVDDLGATNATKNQYASLFVRKHTYPVANAGDNISVNGFQKVTIKGSGTAYDGTSIVSYHWSIAENTTGAVVSLTGTNTSTVSFTAPNTNGYVKLSLRVTDSWNFTSPPSYVTVYINRVIPYAKDLSNAHPDNTVVKPGMNTITFYNLSEGTTAYIYTVGGSLVAEIKAEENYLTWRIPDDLASGVYIVLLKDKKGNTKVIKFIRVR